MFAVWWSYPTANIAACAMALGWFVFGPWLRSLVVEEQEG